MMTQIHFLRNMSNFILFLFHKTYNFWTLHLKFVITLFHKWPKLCLHFYCDGRCYFFYIPKLSKTNYYKMEYFTNIVDMNVSFFVTTPVLFNLKLEDRINC